MLLRVCVSSDVYHFRNSLCHLFLLVNLAWLTLVMVMDGHPELRLLDTNMVGLLSLATFSFTLLVQFAAMIAHRMAQIIITLAET